MLFGEEMAEGTSLINLFHFKWCEYRKNDGGIREYITVKRNSSLLIYYSASVVG